MEFHLSLALIFGQTPHELIESVIRSVGAYPGLFVLLMLGIAGVPLPDELLLTTVGVFAYEGKFEMCLVPTLLVAWAGSSCGITLSYAIGRTAGVGVVHKWGKLLHITPDKLERAHDWYAHKKGRWALMFCIFVPVWRHLTAIVAGTSKMPFWEFMVCAYSGTFLWVSAFISLGYWGDRVFGHAFKETAKRMHLFSNMHSILLVLSILLGAGMLLYVIWKNGRDAKKAAMAAALAGHCGKAEPGERSDSAGPAGPGPLPPGKQ